MTQWISWTRNMQVMNIWDRKWKAKREVLSSSARVQDKMSIETGDQNAPNTRINLLISWCRRQMRFRVTGSETKWTRFLRRFGNSHLILGSNGLSMRWWWLNDKKLEDNGRFSTEKLATSCSFRCPFRVIRRHSSSGWPKKIRDSSTNEATEVYPVCVFFTYNHQSCTWRVNVAALLR